MIQNFKLKKEVNLSDSINLIPMINLVFLLLIFFLLTGIIQKREDPSILIPESNQGMKKDNFSNKQTVQVNEDGILKINNKIIEKDELNKLKTDNIKILILNMDKNIKIKITNEIFKTLKSAGFEKIFINVTEKNASN
ncbi:MAG: hypothetical protein CMM98_00915 [Rickettsiales bacterium]|nr:hypothetical protein [Rickettsiales bacterium]